MKVIVVDSCLEWADMYRTEAQAIREILGENCVAVHHIGSTAVPGLKAKPVIDIMPVVKSLAAVDEKQAAFMRLGYECMGEFGIPGRRYFRKGGENRTHQIHVFAEADGRNVARHLAVRDYLRAHPQRAREYGALKAALAARYPEDIEAYCDGKDAFVRALERDALIWQREREKQ